MGGTAVGGCTRATDCPPDFQPAQPMFFGKSLLSQGLSFLTCEGRAGQQGTLPAPGLDNGHAVICGKESSTGSCFPSVDGNFPAPSTNLQEQVSNFVPGLRSVHRGESSQVQPEARQWRGSHSSSGEEEGKGGKDVGARKKLGWEQ